MSTSKGDSSYIHVANASTGDGVGESVAHMATTPRHPTSPLATVSEDLLRGGKQGAGNRTVSSAHIAECAANFGADVTMPSACY